MWKCLNDLDMFFYFFVFNCFLSSFFYNILEYSLEIDAWVLEFIIIVYWYRIVNWIVMKTNGHIFHCFYGILSFNNFIVLLKLFRKIMFHFSFGRRRYRSSQDLRKFDGYRLPSSVIALDFYFLFNSHVKYVTQTITY